MHVGSIGTKLLPKNRRKIQKTKFVHQKKNTNDPLPGMQHAHTIRHLIALIVYYNISSEHAPHYLINFQVIAVQIQFPVQSSHKVGQCVVCYHFWQRHCVQHVFLHTRCPSQINQSSASGTCLGVDYQISVAISNKSKKIKNLSYFGPKGHDAYHAPRHTLYHSIALIETHILMHW